jgi:hypothetical protein
VLTAIIWAAVVGTIVAFFYWLYRLGKENERLTNMAENQKQSSKAAERVADVLVNDNWAQRLRDKAAAKADKD